jgi:hypothetical protein
MDLGVIFAGPVVSLSTRRRMRGHFPQPHLIIVMEPWLIVIDEHRKGDVHGVDQAKTFHCATLLNEFLDLWRDCR